MTSPDATFPYEPEPEPAVVVDPGHQAGDSAAAPPAGDRRLCRSREHRLIGGVCGCIADYTGLDLTVVRLLAVLSAILVHGVLLYLAAWLLMPEADGAPSIFERHRPTPSAA